MRHGTHRRVAALGVLSLLAGMLGAGPAVAQQETGATTGATVDGTGADPVVLCKWELADDDPSVGGIQYDSGYWNNAGFPCKLDNGELTYGTGDEVIVVPAVSEDDPEERRIELWAAATHPSGPDAVTDVYWKVFHPDGTFKVQEHGVRLANDAVDSELGATWTGSAYNIIGGMWAAASTKSGTFPQGTDQVEEDAVEDANNGLVSLALQDQLDLWRGEFQLSKHQPCGDYRIEAHAVSSTGVDTMIENTIKVACFIDLELDFTSVDWGTITPGYSSSVAGDLDFGTADRPTVKNIGSQGMLVGISYAPLVQQDVPGPKLITAFDGAFGIDPSHLQSIDPIASGSDPGVQGAPAWFVGIETQPFPPDPEYQTICANELGKLDLSVHPQLGLPNGAYAGSMVVYAQGESLGSPTDPTAVCNNSNGVWDESNPGDQR